MPRISLTEIVQLRVKFELNKRKMTHEDLAKRLGCTRQNVHWMLSPKGNLMLDNVERIARILDIDPRSLFELDFVK
jgi:transcriptional regulator with XRE-family HTH domain